MAEQKTASMEDLLKQAEEAGRWLCCCYQDLWFSPAELRAEQRSGRFRWGVENWEVRDPIERLEELERKCHEARRELESFRARMDRRK